MDADGDVLGQCALEDALLGGLGVLGLEGLDFLA